MLAPKEDDQVALAAAISQPASRELCRDTHSPHVSLPFFVQPSPPPPAAPTPSTQSRKAYTAQPSESVHTA